MGVASLVEKLRDKPKETRVQVSFLSALCVTGLVGLLWGLTLPMRLGELPQDDTGEQARSASNLHSFFENTKNSLAQLISGTSEAVPEIPDTDTAGTPPSGAYRVGAPEGQTETYPANPF